MNVHAAQAESVDVVDDKGQLIAKPLGVVLTQGWLHRAVHLAEAQRHHAGLHKCSGHMPAGGAVNGQAEAEAAGRE